MQTRSKSDVSLLGPPTPPRAKREGKTSVPSVVSFSEHPTETSIQAPPRSKRSSLAGSYTKEEPIGLSKKYSLSDEAHEIARDITSKTLPPDAVKLQTNNSSEVNKRCREKILQKYSEPEHEKFVANVEEFISTERLKSDQQPRTTTTQTTAGEDIPDHTQESLRQVQADEGICSLCNEKVTENDTEDGLYCDKCFGWKHVCCLKISNSEYLRLSNSEEDYACPECYLLPDSEPTEVVQ